MVIGTRTAVNVNDLPMQVSVISADDIDNSGATNISEILTDSGEIYIRTSGSSGGRITLRGMAHADTLFLIDGMRINGELNKTYELDRIPAGMIDRIEIVKGSASLLYGSEAMGGVVNIITRKDQNGFSGDVQLLHGANRNGLDVNLFGSRGDTGYRLFASQLERDRFTQREIADLSVSKTAISELSGAHFAPLQAALDDQYIVNRDYQDEMSLSNIGAGLNHRFSETLGLDFNLSYMKEDKERDFISANYQSNYLDNRDRTILVQRLPSEQVDDNRRFSAAASLDYAPLSQLDLRYTLFYSRYDKDTAAYTPFWQEVGYESRDASISNLDQSTTEYLNHDLLGTWTFSASSRLLVGGEHRSIEREAESFSVSDGSHKALFVQHEYQPLERLNLVYGARHESDPVGESATSVSLGASYELTDTLRLKTNYSEGFRSADPEELYINQFNINGRQLVGAAVIDGSKTEAWILRPETSETIEAGILSIGDRYRFELFGFDTRFHDRISRTRLDSTTTTYENIERSRIKGYEGSLTVAMNDRLSGRLTYAGTDAKNQTDNSSIFRTPESLTSLRLSYFPLSNLELRSITKHTGKQVDADGDIPSFSTTNIKLIYNNFARNLDLAFGVDNVLRQNLPEQLGAIRKSNYYVSVKYNFF
ncbi:MAG: TonB-dependent receptor [Pseudohongiellaceae bacterium]